MNGVYFYFVNKNRSRWPLLGLLSDIRIVCTCIQYYRYSGISADFRYYAMDTLHVYCISCSNMYKYKLFLLTLAQSAQGEFLFVVICCLSCIVHQGLLFGHLRELISCLINLVFGQNVCLDKISNEINFGSPGVIIKIPCGYSGSHIYCFTDLKICQNVFLMKSRISTN